MHKILENDLTTRNINHAYLLEADNSEVAFEVAKSFAMKIFNVQSLENNPDFKMILPDDKTIKIDQIREIKQSLIIKPIKHDKKVYIINESEKMTEQAQNCILKMLEEPPEYTVMILTCTSSSRLLRTIFSRVKRIKILEDNDTENIKFSKAEEIVDNAGRTDILNALQYATFFKDNQEEIKKVLEYMLIYSRKLIENFMLSGKSKSDSISIIKVSKNIELIEDTLQRLEKNYNFGMTIDYMLIKMQR